MNANSWIAEVVNLEFNVVPKMHNLDSTEPNYIQVQFRYNFSFKIYHLGSGYYQKNLKSSKTLLK